MVVPVFCRTPVGISRSSRIGDRDPSDFRPIIWPFVDVPSSRQFYAVGVSNIRILVVDDDALVRRALVTFLSSPSDMEVIGEASNGAEAVEAVAREHPDVVVMDLQMPVMDGVEAMARITTDWPDVRVLAVTTFGTIERVLPALRAGASGYLLKDAEPEDIIAAARGVLGGAAMLSASITELLVNSVQAARQPVVQLTSAEELSGREADVVRELGLGKSNQEIALALHVSEGTIKAQLSSIMMKWGARDRVQVLIRAARAGLISFQ